MSRDDLGDVPKKHVLQPGQSAILFLKGGQRMFVQLFLEVTAKKAAAS